MSPAPRESLWPSARIALAALLCAGLAAHGVAQSPSPAPTAPPANRTIIAMESLIVTGTNLPVAADAMPEPVTVLGPADLAASGTDANLLEILRHRVPAFSGGGNLGNSNANVSTTSTGGGSQLALRNLDTLVLINGRRVATSGANARGGNSFVDVNQIPPAAIQRIEIVTDGASAIYGSDAVGGVVNLILKSDYQGAEFGGRYAAATGAGNYTERSASLLAGAAAAGVRVTASVSASKTDRLMQSDRPFSASITGRNATIAGAVGEGPAFPKYFLSPALNSPRERNPTGTAAVATSMAQLAANGTYQDLGSTAFATIANTFDLAPATTLLLGQERKSAWVTASADLLGKKLGVFADYLGSETEGTSQLPAQGTTPTITVPAGAPYNPTTGAVSQVAFRYLPYTRPFTNTTHLDRAVLGLRGALTPDWSWEAAYNWNLNRNTLRVKNVFYGPNVDRAVAGGFNAQGVPTPGGAFSRVLTGFSEASGTFVIQPALDPFARAPAVNPASLENVYGTYVGAAWSKLTSYDFKVTGRLIELPAGKIALAAGGDFRREELAAIPDENARLTGPTAGRWLAVPLFDPFNHARRTQAGFAEVRVPVTGAAQNLPGLRELDLTAAYRVESYSDSGHSRAPKLGLRWQPVDPQLTLRGTYSEAFTAPPLFSLFGPVTRVFTPAAVIPNVFGLSGQAQAQSGANPNLRPSTATTHSFGLSFSPKAVKGLTASLDLVRTTQRNIVGSVGVTTILQSVEQLGAQSPYASQVAFGNFPGERDARLVTRPGELGAFLRAGNSPFGIYVADTRTNLAGQRLNACDVNLDYAVSLASGLGQLRLGTTGTFFIDDQFQALPSQPFFEYAGHATNGGTGAQGTIPGYRFHSRAAWLGARWDVTIINTYLPSVTDLGPGGMAFATSPTLRRNPVASYLAWDLSAGYTFEASRSPRGLRRYFQGLKVTAGINNVTHRLPPLAPQAFNESNADIATYSVVGRLLFVNASVRF